jgi:hypothetical protein
MRATRRCTPRWEAVAPRLAAACGSRKNRHLHGARFASENDYALQRPSYGLLDDGQRVTLPRIESTPDTTRVVRDWDPDNVWDNARGPVPVNVPLAGAGDEFMRGWRDPRAMQRSVMDAPASAAETAGRYSGALADSFKNFGMGMIGANSMNAAQANWRGGNYGTSLLQRAAAFGEAGMTAFSLGVGSAAGYGATITAAEWAAARGTGANSAERVVFDFFGGRTSQIPGAINVDIAATQGVRASATQLPFQAGIADEIIASNSFIPGGSGIMDFLPGAAQTLKVGGQVIINATHRNPFGMLPDAKALEELGLRVIQQNGPLLLRFENNVFRFTDGRVIPNTSVRTTILKKVK